ncbi:MAG: peptidoglycan-binding protein [Pseudomonadota bacterium]
MMKTSAAGIAFLERHEGVVLKAYRDPVGIWTIGAGLTKASGVVDPRPGMALTKKQATGLLKKALANNYEPRVRKAMPGAAQHEFDGGVSFDWNLGRIHNASWVKAWRARNWPAVERGLNAYRKAGGRVLRGLVRRRQEEFDLIRHGRYGVVKQTRSAPGLARFVFPVDGEAILEMRGQFETLGYAPGGDLKGLSEAAVRQFQRDHDLTVDGIIGNATRATLQRMIDARRKSAQAAVGAASGGGGAGVGLQTTDFATAEILWVLGGLAGIALLFAAYLAWTYRDAVAVKVQKRLPKLAVKLRSI